MDRSAEDDRQRPTRPTDQQGRSAAHLGDVDERNESADEGSFRRLPSSFRLKKQSLIRPLFDRSRDDVGSTAKGCVRLLYRTVPQEEVGADVPVQVGFAPGRAPKAVQRNHIKRVLREVYRVSQDDLIDLFSDTGTTLTLMILHRGDPAQASDAIRRDLPEALRTAVDYLRGGHDGETSMREEQR